MDIRIYTFKFFGDNYLLCDIEYYCLAQSDTDRPHAVSRSDVTDWHRPVLSLTKYMCIGNLFRIFGDPTKII